MKKFTLLLAITSSLVLFSCQKDSEDTISSELDSRLEVIMASIAPNAQLSWFTLPDATDFGKIPQDPNNPLTTTKVNLGQMLYHETGLALNPKIEFSKGTYSCASCHFASAGFQANRSQGIGDGAIGFGINGEGRAKHVFYQDTELDVQPIRTPTVLNGAYQTNMLWNGQFGATGTNVGTENLWTEETPKAMNHLGFEGLEIQAIAGLGVHRLLFDERAELLEWYQNYFDEVFTEIPPTERYTNVTAGLAIAAYERTVLSNQAPFQQWIKGNKNAMSDIEKRGAILFFDKANCSSCHTGPALSSMKYTAIGMKDLQDCPEEIFATTSENPTHKGRASFTGDVADEYKFKVPQLYNLADSPFYGHGSSFRTIREVIEYKNQAQKENSQVPNSQLAEEFTPLNLSETEISELTAFVTHALRDDDLLRYQPSNLPSGQCFPNNDPMSRNQLGCD